jgi:hypothetical protein
MVLKRFTSLLAALILTLGACATVQKYDASGDIHTFLVAVRDGDKATFDAHIDKPALKAQLRARLIAEVATIHGAESNETAGAVLAGPLVDIGVEVLLRPDVFRAAAEMLGYGPDRPIPNMLIIGHQVKPLPDERVCVIIGQSCSFVFKREEGVWKMIAFEGDIGALERRLKKRL